jgi:hypothetical protein
MSRSTRIVRLFLLLMSALAAAIPVTAQTILLAVGETANGTPLAPPLPTGEGVAGSLFDIGFIVFDLPGDGPSRGLSELIGVARSAGADLVLDVRVQYSDRPIDAGATRISGTAVFTLADAASGVVKAKGEEAATNANREKDVDRAALGQEIGRMLAARIRDALSPASR